VAGLNTKKESCQRLMDKRWQPFLFEIQRGCTRPRYTVFW
jgi:hypothetical protein